ncbi:hypothetical protein [Streptococcus sobrinus]|uniref:Uncharacterized protein n=1 Tax=Streptococcus sobrinus W1703 TaxID=1227275 RepID=U2KFS1_9STRE|nr:hypothetical protein [Streptococcus sobrinus]ERJ73678.1 hypothetical protein HMPREF1557_02250 [Streptococcus sobrinus W1703]
MPIKYYEIKKLLREEVALFDSLMSKFLKYFLLYFFIVMFFGIGLYGTSKSGGSSTNSNGSVLFTAISLIILGCYRAVVVLERLNLKNVAIKFKKGKFLDEEQVSLLISEVDLSLKKINHFANWSCGVLATILIFAVTTLVNFLKETLTSQEISELFTDRTGLQNNLISFLASLAMLVIFCILFYYLTVQTFTYNRRFVVTILKSSLYITEEDEIMGGFWNKVVYVKENFWK